MLFLFFIFITSRSNDCYSNMDEVILSLSIQENQRFDIIQHFMSGSLLSFSIVGDQTGLFKLEEPIYLKETYNLEQLGEMISQKFFIQSGLQTNLYSILSKTDLGISIYYSSSLTSLFGELNQILVSQENCIDHDYLNELTFVVVCVEDSKLVFYVVNTQDQSFQYQTNIDFLDKKLIFRIKGDMLLIGYSNSNLDVLDSQIDTFKVLQGSIIQLPTSINKQFLSTISSLKSFVMVDFYVSIDGELNILEQNNGVIYLKYIYDAWTRVRFHNPTNGFYVSFAVGYDEYLNSYSALYYGQKSIMILVNGYIFSNQQFRQNISDPVNIQISNKYQVIQYGNFLEVQQFDWSTALDLGRIYVEDIQSFKLHPNLPQLIVFTSTQIKVYQLSKGQIVYENKLDQLVGHSDQFFVVGQSKDQSCLSKVSYKIFSNTDSNIYIKTSQSQPFYDIIPYPQAQQTQIVSTYALTGPNIRMKCKVNGFDQVKIGGSFVRDQILLGITLPTDIRFIKMNQDIRKQLKFQMFTQLSNNSLNSYLCENKDTFDQISCSQVNFINAKFPLNDSNFKIKSARVNIYEEVIHIGIISDQNLEYYEMVSQTNKVFHLEAETQDFQFGLTYIYFLQNNIINVYNISTQILIYKIDQELIKLYGYQERWNPVKIETNLQFMPNVVFIQNYNGDIIIGISTFSFQIISTLSFPQKEVKFYIQSKGFLIVIVSYNGVHEIKEYNIQNLQNIYFTKNYPQYDYLIHYPLQVYNVDQSNNILILAYTPILRQHVFLVYQSDVSLRDSLLTIIETGQYYKDKLDFVLGVSGSYSLFGLFHTQQKNKFFLLKKYIQSEMTYELAQSSQFIYEAVIESTFFNIDGFEQLDFEQSVLFVNNNIKIQAYSKEITVSKDEKVILLDRDWFYGQIMQYGVEYPMDQNMKIVQPLQTVDFADFGDTKFIYQCSLGDKTAYLTKESILFYSYDFKVSFQPIIIEKVQSQYCYKIICDEKSKVVILSCENYNYDNYIYYYDCSQGNQCKQYGGLKQLISEYSIKQIVIIEDNLVVMGQYSIFYSIKFFRMKIDEGNLNLIPGNTDINKTFVDQQFGPQQMAYQIFKINGNTVYKLFITDYKQGLWWIDCKFNQRMLTPVKVMKLNNLDLLLRESKLFIVSYTSYCWVKPTKDVIEHIQDGTLETNLLITTQYSYSFGVRIIFRGSIQISIQITYVLLNFASWQTTQDDISVFNGYAVLKYQSNTAKRLIGVYKLPNDARQNLSESPTLVVGGIFSDYVQYSIFFLTQTKEKVSLIYNSQETRLVRAEINDYGYVVITNNTLSNFTVVANNYYYSDTLVVKLEVYIAPKSYQNLIIIISISLGSLIILLLCLGFRFFKKKKYRDSNTTVISLME